MATDSFSSRSQTVNSELEHIRRLHESNYPQSPIYNFLLGPVKIVDAGKGFVRATLQIQKQHVNSHGSLHGAVSATLVDWLGGMAIATHDQRAKTGVSTDMHITFVSTAKEGDVLVLDGVANKVGGTLAFTTITISKSEDGKPGAILASGSHTKYVKTQV